VLVALVRLELVCRNCDAVCGPDAGEAPADMCGGWRGDVPSGWVSLGGAALAQLNWLNQVGQRVYKLIRCGARMNLSPRGFSQPREKDSF